MRRVRLGAGNYCYRRRSDQTFLFDIPTNPGVHRVAPRRQTREVRQRAAGGKSDARIFRQPKQIDELVGSDLFRRRCQRRVRIESAILVPRRGQPISSQRRRQRTSNHETKISRSSSRDYCTVG